MITPAKMQWDFARRAPQLFCLIWFCAGLFSAMAAEVMPPKPANHFNDYANAVPASIAQQLDQKLTQFERDTSDQVVVAVYPKMQSDSDINDYAQRVAQKWQVGLKEKNNGVVLLVFVQDRKMSIQVGYGLEGVFPDVLTKRIQEDVIKPHFKNGDYAGGLSAGVDAILQVIKGEYKGTGHAVGEQGSESVNPVGILMLLLFFGFFGFIFLRALTSRGTVYGRRGRYYGGFWGGGGGGGWSGGSSGGGGGSFSSGGGSFGGGGSSSSW